MTDPPPAAVDDSGRAPHEATELSIIGHAGLFVREGDKSVLVDPWLGGSAYWRSWWQYPPPVEATLEMLSPSAVMLSHAHFDHFHFPSMRRIDRTTEVLIPKFGVQVMVDELKGLGFTRVRELEHARRYELAPSLSVASYQYGLDDSLLVIAAGAQVVFDMNDCKIRGSALDEALAEFGRPTFMLKNYSAAQAYPHCYRSEDPADLEMIDPTSYIEDFLESARAAQPRYAVPFASMVCFLHPDTYRFNQTVVTPDRIAEAAAATPMPGTDVVVLAPGDSWSASKGFSISGVDWKSDRHESIAAQEEKVRGRIAAATAQEAATELSFVDFRNYLEGFARALPFVVRRLFTRPIAFRVDDGYFVVDIRARRVERSDERPENWASIVTIAPGLLADAIEKRILNLVHISMRIEVELAPGGLSVDLSFWAMLIIYELGYFPLSALDRRRLSRLAWRRRRELWDMARVTARTKGSLAQRLSASFIASPSS